MMNWGKDNATKTEAVKGPRIDSIDIVNMIDAQTGEVIKSDDSGHLHSMCSDGCGGLYISNVIPGKIAHIDGDGNFRIIHFDFKTKEKKPCDIAGMAIDESYRNIYFTDSTYHCIRCVDTRSNTSFVVAGQEGKKGYMDGDASTALFKSPCGITFDEEEQILYVCDSYNFCVRMINLRSRSVQLVAGCRRSVHLDKLHSEAGFVYPTNISLDRKAGAIYVSDSESHTIRKIDIKSCAVTTFAGSLNEDGDVDGHVRRARLSGPRSIELGSENRHDGTQYVYICDSMNHKIRCLNISKSQEARVDTLIGGDAHYKCSPPLSFPNGMLMSSDGSKLYVHDDAGLRCISFLPTSTETASFTIPPSTLAEDLMRTYGDVSLPQGVVSLSVGSSGRCIEHVSKCVLCVRSTFFNALIRENKESNVINLPDHDYELVDAAIRYFLTDKIETSACTTKMLYNLLRASTVMEAPRMGALCLHEIFERGVQGKSIVANIQMAISTLKKIRAKSLSAKSQGNDAGDMDAHSDAYQAALEGLVLDLRKKFSSEPLRHVDDEGMAELTDISVARGLLKDLARENSRLRAKLKK